MISGIIILVVILGLFGFFGKKTISSLQDKNWYQRLVISREDTVSQLFLLLSFLLFGVALAALDRDFGDLLGWRNIFLIVSVVAMIGAYYFKAIYILIAGLIGGWIWWASQAYVWLENAKASFVALTVGLVFIALIYYAVGRLHEREKRYQRFALIYNTLSVIFVTGVLFFFSTRSGLDAFANITNGKYFWNCWQVMVCMIVFFLSFCATMVKGVMDDFIKHTEALALVVIAFIFGAILFISSPIITVQNNGYLYQNELSGDGMAWAVLFNLLIFLELLGLILFGYVKQEKRLVNLGALFMSLLIITKYFDWFFSFLDKSVFFIGSGILLFGVGWFMEKGRRYMLANMEDKKYN